MLNSELNAGKFRYNPKYPEDSSRIWAEKNGLCPLDTFGDDNMCIDCSDGCPLASPEDPKNGTDTLSRGKEQDV